MAIIAINGLDMPSPQTMEISYREIGKNETNAAGQKVMDRVALKRDLKCVWRYLSKEDAGILLGQITPEPFMDVSFVDPVTGENAEGEYKAADTVIKPNRYANGFPVGYADITINFQER